MRSREPAVLERDRSDARERDEELEILFVEPVRRRRRCRRRARPARTSSLPMSGAQIAERTLCIRIDCAAEALVLRRVVGEHRDLLVDDHARDRLRNDLRVIDALRWSREIFGTELAVRVDEQDRDAVDVENLIRVARRSSSRSASTSTARDSPSTPRADIASFFSVLSVAVQPRPIRLGIGEIRRRRTRTRAARPGCRTRVCLSDRRDGRAASPSACAHAPRCGTASCAMQPEGDLAEHELVARCERCVFAHASPFTKVPLLEPRSGRARRAASRSSSAWRREIVGSKIGMSLLARAPDQQCRALAQLERLGTAGGDDPKGHGRNIRDGRGAGRGGDCRGR